MGVLGYVRNQWDRVGAWACIVAGVIALFVGYLGVSGTPATGEQLPYLVSGGMVGLFLLGLGTLLWLSAELRDEWRKLDAIDRHLLEAGSLPAPAGSQSPGARPADPQTGNGARAQTESNPGRGGDQPNVMTQPLSGGRRGSRRRPVRGTSS